MVPTCTVFGYASTNLPNKQKEGIKSTACKLHLPGDHFSSLVFLYLHPSHYQPIFIWQTFPSILKPFWSGSVNYFLLPTVQIQLKFNCIWSACTQNFLVSCFLVFQSVTDAVHSIPYGKEWARWGTQNRKQQPSKDLSDLTLAQLAQSLIILNTDIDKGMHSHPLSQDVMVENQRHTKCLYSQSCSSWIQLFSWSICRQLQSKEAEEGAEAGEKKAQHCSAPGDSRMPPDAVKSIK